MIVWEATQLTQMYSQNFALLLPREAFEFFKSSRSVGAQDRESPSRAARPWTPASGYCPGAGLEMLSFAGLCANFALFAFSLFFELEIAKRNLGMN